MVEQYKPFCRACKDFHEESGCHYACYVQEHGHPEGCGLSTSTSETEFINNIDDIPNIPIGNWPKANCYEKKVDNLTQYYGEMPSAEQINNTQNFKGITYQRKGSSTQNIPKVTAPNPPKEVETKEIIDLSFDLGNWLANTKVPVPVLELCKIPGQREILLKILEPQSNVDPQAEESSLGPLNPITPKKVTFSATVERTSNNIFADPPIVLHTRDPRKENHPPFLRIIDNG